MYNPCYLFYINGVLNRRSYDRTGQYPIYDWNHMWCEVQCIRCKGGTMRTLLLAIIGVFFISTLAGARQGVEEDPAMKAQNPLADIVGMPFQNNTDFGIGDFNRTSNVLNIQPIYPVHLGKEWILINRAIVPFPKTVPDVGAESESTTGLGDINYTAWFVPRLRVWVQR